MDRESEKWRAENDDGEDSGGESAGREGLLREEEEERMG